MPKLAKRKDGRYKRQFTYNGKKYYVYASSKQELDEKEFQKRKQLESQLETRTNPTLDDYQKTWTESRKGTVREATLRSQKFQYQACSNVMIKNAGKRFGELKLREITADDVREVQRYLHANNHSAQSTNDFIAHLSHIFNTAYKERQIEYNPCVAVANLKRDTPQARDTVHRALSLQEQSAFFEAAKTSQHYNLFRFMINTGMRCGECGALLLSDIYDNKIHINKTLTKSELGNYVIGDSAKTASGCRDIPINDTIREIIDSQRKYNKLVFGNVISIHDTLFKAPEGGLLDNTPVNREIRRICKRANITRFSAHAFRATFATRAIEAGMNPRTLQELLGHKDYAITMNLYGHVLDDTKQDAMKDLKII